MTYWTGIEYLGLGLGASSYFKGCRYKNTSDTKLYLRNTAEKITMEELFLTAEDKMEEYMFLGLRLKKGVSISVFEKQFCVPMDTIYGREIEKIKDKGLLLQRGDNLRLSKKGTDVANYVMSQFIL
jgi:oxygen-independent coproporphyrinogen-3 oxidase